MTPARLLSFALYATKYHSMLKNFVSALIFIVALVFGLIALVYLSITVAVGELDDVRIIQFVGLPSIVVSVYLSILLLGLRKFGIFLIVGILNSISSLAGFLASLPGVFDIMVFTNKSFHGHQGNNYTSLDLFIIGIVPLKAVCLGWVLFVKARQADLELSKVLST